MDFFNYGFYEAQEAFKQGNIAFKSLTDYDILIKLAIEKGIISSNEQETLFSWRNNPAVWGLKE